MLKVDATLLQFLTGSMHCSLTWCIPAHHLLDLPVSTRTQVVDERDAGRAVRAVRWVEARKLGSELDSGRANRENRPRGPDQRGRLGLQQPGRGDGAWNCYSPWGPSPVRPEISDELSGLCSAEQLAPVRQNWPMLICFNGSSIIFHLERFAFSQT